MGIFGYITSSIGLALEVWLSVLLVRRKAHRNFPMFFLYVVFEIWESISGLSVYSNLVIYYFVFWANNVIVLIISTLALLEVFRWVFVLFWLRWWFRGALYGAMAGALALAIYDDILYPPVSMETFGGLIFTCGIAVYFVQLTIFALFCLLSKHLQIRFRRYAFGIMLGFAIIALGALVPRVFWREFKMNFFMRVYTPAIMYLLGLIFWLHVFLQRERPIPEWSLSLTPDQLADQIKQQAKIFKRL
jgi:hypothetical protein